MRFLLFLCFLCSIFGVTTLYKDALHPPQCAPFTAPILPGPLTTPHLQAGIVVINEVLPLSPHTWDCSELGTARHDHNMWIELYNPQNQAFDLSSIYASFDNGPGTKRSYFPFGASIAAHGFLVVFPENSYSFSTTETSSLRLLFDGFVIDQINIPLTIGIDEAYARIPDGGPAWQIIGTPTIDASNNQNTLPATPAYTPTAHSTKESGTGRTKQGSSNKSTSGHSTSTTNPAAGQPATVDGTQPAWSNLQLPSGNSSSPKATSSANTGPNSTMTLSSNLSNDTIDVQHKILFTALALLLVCILFLCWRRFKPT